MYPIILLIVLIFISHSMVSADTTNEKCWESIIGSESSEVIRDIKQTSNGSFIAVGTTTANGAMANADIWVITLDDSGRLVNESIYGGNHMDKGYGIITHKDGSYLVLGSSIHAETNQSSIWLFKADAQGNILWEKNYGEDYIDIKGLTISKAPDNNYFIAGYAHRDSDKKWDGWVAKINSSGAILWEKILGGKDHEAINAIHASPDNGLLLAGYTRSQGQGKSDVWIIKLNTLGILEWEKIFGGADYDEVYAIEATEDKGYLILATTSSKGAGSSDIWLMKINAQGEKLWDKVYGGEDYDDAYGITRTHDGQFLLVTSTYSKGEGLSDIWLIKLDNTGEIIWDYTLGGKDFDEAYIIRATEDGGYILAGNTRSRALNQADGWVIKLNSEGFLDYLQHF